MQSRRIIHMLVALVITVAMPAGLRGEPSLDSRRRAHETKVSSLRTEHALKAEELLKVYGQALEKLIVSLQKAGDPDPVISAMEEKRRFERERTVPDSETADLPEAVTRLRASYRRAVAENEAAERRRIAAVNADYLAILNRLMQKLTAEGKLALALNVKQEKRRIEFIVADAEGGTAQPAKPVSLPGVVLPPGLRSGLVLHYGFDSDEGGSVTDKSGKGNHGRRTGARWANAGSVGGGMSFDGTSSMIVSRGPVTMAQPFTVALCARAGRTGAERQGVFSSRRNRNNMPTITRRRSFQFSRARDGSVSLDRMAVTPLGKIRSQTFTHLACTFGEEGTVLYQNGQKTGAVQGLPAAISEPLLGTNRRCNEFFAGVLDEVMIWNRELPESEVRQLSLLLGCRGGPSPSAIKRTINVTGSEITRGKWRPCLKVKAGTEVTVTAEALAGIEQVRYSGDSFRIREGKNGREYVFDTKGLFVESYTTKRKTLTFTAAEDEDLYVMPKQDNRFRLSVILDPPR